MSSYSNQNVAEDVGFTLGEDIRTETRLLQDETWKTAVADGRSHVSNREYSSLHSSEFICAIEDFKTVSFLLAAYSSRHNILRKLNIELLKLIVEYALPGQSPLVMAEAAILNEKTKRSLALNALILSASAEGRDRRGERERDREPSMGVDELTENLNGLPNDNSFRICARCRPLLDYEKEGGAYCCVDPSKKSSEIVVHDGRLARNGRQLTMAHKAFPLNRVWDVDASNDEVCQSEVEPLLVRVKQGYSSSLLCFGQTGTNNLRPDKD
jgi:hypothetical protein